VPAGLAAHRGADNKILKIARSFKGQAQFLATLTAPPDFPRTGLCVERSAPLLAEVARERAVEHRLGRDSPHRVFAPATF